jgi:hypothetical protein
MTSLAEGWQGTATIDPAWDVSKLRAGGSGCPLKRAVRAAFIF